MPGVCSSVADVDQLERDLPTEEIARDAFEALRSIGHTVVIPDARRVHGAGTVGRVGRASQHAAMGELGRDLMRYRRRRIDQDDALPGDAARAAGR